ncbi:MAG TPA: hypothetical protein VLR89_08480 [Anaerolineaceae bacterium]|nr:hypothetical protein [Anaerolineaceae bacterium]
MVTKNRLILPILLGIALLLFCLAILPNRQASENLAMVTMLQPDEGVVIPVMQRMISGGATLKQTLAHFIVYEYYYYGLPFFGLGALLMLALRGLGLEGNFALSMLVLRQTVSVLPTLAGLLVLTYIQDQFKTWRSIAIFLFLAIIPATMRNAFWLHPDGLVIFFSAMVLYFLWKDNAQLGKHFYWAAAFCGTLTATKLVGLYFFLAVLLCLALYLSKRQGNWKQAAKAGALFIGLMLLCFLFSNAFLFSEYGRIQYLYTLQGQASWLANGYGVVYPKGLASALPVLEQDYGSAGFVLLALALTLFGIWQQRSRFNSALILAWVLPFSISVIFFTHFKYQYWLPVGLPLYSSFALLLPEKFESSTLKPGMPVVVRIGLILLVLVQSFMFLRTDETIIKNRFGALEGNPAMAFYNESMHRLDRLQGTPQNVYFDYRLYLPTKESWSAATNYDLLDYAYIHENKFTILMLSAQRIADYLSPAAVGVDPQKFIENQRFYGDAKVGKLTGYHLLYSDQTALLFISQEVCLAQFPEELCSQ